MAQSPLNHMACTPQDEMPVLSVRIVAGAVRAAFVSRVSAMVIRDELCEF
jgi:hypothetical protein